MKTVGYRLIAVALVGVALTLMSDVFFTSSNLLNVLRQASLTFLIASGLTLTILTAGLDLSVGANVGLSACLAATVMKATDSMALGVAAGLLCGGVIGILNGMMITLLRLPPFLPPIVVGCTASPWFMAAKPSTVFRRGSNARRATGRRARPGLCDDGLNAHLRATPRSATAALASTGNPLTSLVFPFAHG